MEAAVGADLLEKGLVEGADVPRHLRLAGLAGESPAGRR